MKEDWRGWICPVLSWNGWNGFFMWPAGLLQGLELMVVRPLTWWLTNPRASVPRDQDGSGLISAPLLMVSQGPIRLNIDIQSEYWLNIPKGMNTKPQGSPLETSYLCRAESGKKSLWVGRKAIWRSQPKARRETIFLTVWLRVLLSSLVGKNWKLQLKSINSMFSCIYLYLKWLNIVLIPYHELKNYWQIFSLYMQIPS